MGSPVTLSSTGPQDLTSSGVAGPAEGQHFRKGLPFFGFEAYVWVLTSCSFFLKGEMLFI